MAEICSSIPPGFLVTGQVAALRFLCFGFPFSYLRLCFVDELILPQHSRFVNTIFKFFSNIFFTFCSSLFYLFIVYIFYIFLNIRQTSGVGMAAPGRSHPATHSSDQEISARKLSIIPAASSLLTFAQNPSLRRTVYMPSVPG